MSGGHFEYNQYHIDDIVYSIERIIENNNKPSDEDEYYHNFNDNTIEKFKLGLHYLKIAKIYAHRIDWLVSGDDGEESFMSRLEEDLRNLNLE